MANEEDDVIGEGHNSADGDSDYRAASGELRQFIERYERLDADKKEIADQQKEIMQEAKARGYNPTIIKQVISLRKKDPDEVAEQEAVLDMYKQALGM